MIVTIIPIGRLRLESLSSSMVFLVPGAGLEPTRLSAKDFKSLAATNYATRAIRVMLRD